MPLSKAVPFRNGARLASGGFSLVEVALALGVVAFAFVGLMAMLPVGLAAHRSSIDASVGAQLLQRVTGDAEQTDFDTFISSATEQAGGFYALPTRFFDEQGNELPATAAGKAIYQVRVRGSTPGPADVSQDGPGCFTSLPAAAGQTRFNPRQVTFLAVQIANNPGNRPLAEDPALLWKASAGVPLKTYSAVLVRNGYLHASGS